MGVYESASAGGIPLHKRARLLRIIHVPTSKPNDSAIFVRAWLGSRATRTIPAMTDVHHKIAHKGGGHLFCSYGFVLSPYWLH
jgi:hypothetical protein